MKLNPIYLLACLAFFAADTARSADLYRRELFNRNRFSLTLDAGFNVSAEFRNLAPNLAPPPATGSGLTGDPVDRDYEDGYNRVDFFDNGGGLTWNWGYDSDAQYVDTDNDNNPDSLAMHSTARSGYGTSTDVTDDPQLGFELKYGRVIGKLAENTPWGFELAFAYMDLLIQDDGGMSSVQRVTDTYALGGVVPPPAPYQGTFNGPGPLIPDLPNRSVEPALVSGWNKLDGSMFALRLGPFVELPLSIGAVTSGWTNSTAPSKYIAQVGAGLSLIYADVDYSYSQTAAFADGSTLTDRGSNPTSEVLVGGYLQAQVGYLIDENWSVFGGVRLETATGLTATAGNREADLDLGATIRALLGVGYSF